MNKLVVKGNTEDIRKLTEILMKSMHDDYNSLLERVEFINIEGEEK